MTITMPTVDPTTIKADDLHDKLDVIQRFINIGIDSQSSNFAYGEQGVLESKHVYKPDLFGSPSPKVTNVSSQTHWRSVSNDWTQGVTFSAGSIGNDWVGVPGLCTRIKITEPARLHYSASFYVFEMGGATESKASWSWIIRNQWSRKKDAADRDRTAFGHEYHAAGYIALSVNGSIQNSTMRTVYTSNVVPTEDDGTVENNGHIMFQMISRHQQSIVKRLKLNPGIHDIGIVCKPREVDLLKLKGQAREENSEAYMQEHKNIFFLARSMIADLVYE